MGRKILISLIFLLLLAGVVSAGTTQINIKTYPLRSVGVFILKPNEVYSLYESFHKDSDVNGLVQINYTGEPSTIDIKVQVTENNNPLVIERLTELKTGSPLYLQVIAGDIKKNYNEGVIPPEQNLTQTNATANTTNTNRSVITGQTISDTDYFSWLKTWHIIAAGAILLLLVVGFFAFRNFSSISSSLPSLEPKSQKVVDYSANNNLNSELSETKRKLQAAEKEIIRIKNESKAKEIEDRIKREQEELAKLKKDY